MTNQVNNQSLMPSTDVIQLTLTLKMTTAQVVDTSVTVNSNSPIQDYVHPDDQTHPTNEMTPGFKPFITCRLSLFYRRWVIGWSATKLCFSGDQKIKATRNKLNRWIVKFRWEHFEGVSHPLHSMIWFDSFIHLIGWLSLQKEGSKNGPLFWRRVGGLLAVSNNS